ncbi:PepSY-associated TM helix domain-containing protein [Actinomycetospora straminea]|uniref:PepSY-associated TM helix domain-containing protein n=1 Tax=Actinomycetospora straminea TaxID=663607 RepID=A0ABP9E0H8_9PSEU|nr:PepSY-associated TM helix domain-containing protein [Actinomycetospora straminea]MDD7931094.1 PepSY-associated TM helix domain-containing protein [Actinomycetospora straminea]
MTIDDQPAPTRAPAPARPGTWALLRPLVLRVHFWGGVLVGPFLLVAALTGFVYTLMPSLEPVVYRHELTVPASDARVPLADQVRVGMDAMPGTALRSVRPGPTPIDTTQVIANDPALPESSSRTAFVDPHTGDLRGVLETYGSGQAMPLRAWVDQLHRNLHLGDAGRLYTELAASWLWVLVLAGLALWVGLVRRRRRERASALLVPRVAGGRRARLLSWHAVVGLWAALGLLFLSATGLTWSTYAGENVGALRAQLSWATPEPANALPGATAAGHEVGAHSHHAEPAPTAAPTTAPTTAPTADAPPGSFDLAARVAADAGLDGLIEISPGDGPGSATTVTQIDRTWPEEHDAIALDPATGQVTDVVRFADWPLAARLATYGIDAHMGYLFGVANQVVLGVLALGLACVVVWGWVLWFRRGPGRRPGHVPADGVLRSLPRGLLAGVVAVTVVVGLLVPLLGASLLAFLLLETLLDRRRTGAPTGSREPQKT